MVTTKSIVYLKKPLSSGIYTLLMAEINIQWFLEFTSIWYPPKFLVIWDLTRRTERQKQGRAERKKNHGKNSQKAG